eukprot:7391533-Pyramimonas_sp.AAC.1
MACEGSILDMEGKVSPGRSTPPSVCRRLGPPASRISSSVLGLPELRLSSAVLAASRACPAASCRSQSDAGRVVTKWGEEQWEKVGNWTQGEKRGSETRGVECTLAVFGTGGPVKRSNINTTYIVTKVAARWLSAGCCVHPCRYWHRRTREKQSHVMSYEDVAAAIVAGFR